MTITNKSKQETSAQLSVVLYNINSIFENNNGEKNWDISCT